MARRIAMEQDIIEMEDITADITAGIMNIAYTDN
jgi:hypothetical protein